MSFKVRTIPAVIAALVLVLAITPLSDATLQRLLRRQSEQESTPTANNDLGQQSSSGGGGGGGGGGGSQQQQPARLYPDLPRPPPYPAGPTPFVPFGFQPQPMMGQPPMLGPSIIQQPRPIMNNDRLRESQTFTNGLGRRLLSMIGIESPPSESNTNATSANQMVDFVPSGERNTMIKALTNSTVLQQLNAGLQSFYGGLSKMYNSTVQQQLDILRDRFQREAENSTQPWQQRMAQQVPQFFQRAASKVNEAQQRLNQVLHQMAELRNRTQSQEALQTRSSLGPGNNQFFPNSETDLFGNPQMSNENNFLNQLGRTFGFRDQQQQQPRDLGSQLMDFWHQQVQPQMNMIRGMAGRVWRDLTQSGALVNSEPIMRMRNQPSQMNQPKEEASASDLVDNILKDVDTSSSEFKLLEPVDNNNNNNSNSNSNSQQQRPTNRMGSQMQARLMDMQRELNQLWSGLSNSIQGALSNVRQTLNPNTQFAPSNFVNNGNKETDPAENEISAKIKDLNKVQKDADVVYDIVQQQQQQQQRPTFVDRFRNFFGNMDFDQVDNFSNRVGEQVSRFGMAVGDLWHQIPGRWDNFVQNVRQQDPLPRLMTPSSTTTKKPQMMENSN